MFDVSQVAFSAFWWENLGGEDDIGSVCESLSSLGYRGVEWKETCFAPIGDVAKALPLAARATRAQGMEVPAFVILRNLTDADTTEKSSDDVRAFIRASAAAGVGLVNTASSGVLSKAGSPEEWWKPTGPDWTASWDTFERSMAKILRVAESEGVTIVFETIVGTLIHDYYSTLELLRRLDSPNLALTMDPSHYIIHENDIGCAIRILGRRIRHVHVKDAVGHPGVFGRDFLFPILGEGAVDWTDFFAALGDIGYEGWLSLEFESFKYMNEVLKGDALEAARTSMRSYMALSGWDGGRPEG